VLHRLAIVSLVQQRNVGSVENSVGDAPSSQVKGMRTGRRSSRA
jgi:hypothetical protein